MATKPATYESGANYRVTVNRVVPLGGAIVLRPTSAKIVITGAVAMTIDDAIETAEKV